MTLSPIRRLVEALKQKYADELEVYRLRPVAQQFCDDMANAVTGKKRGRRRSLDEWAEIFFKRVRERGLNPQQGLAHLSSYLERCLDRRVLPPASRNSARTAAQRRPPRPHPSLHRKAHTLLGPNRPAQSAGAC